MRYLSIEEIKKRAAAEEIERKTREQKKQEEELQRQRELEPQRALERQKELERQNELKRQKEIALKQFKGMMLLNVCKKPEYETKFSCINTLISEGADVNYQNEEGQTALFCALDIRSFSIAEYLMKLGADPFLEDKRGICAAKLVPSDSALHEIIKTIQKEKELLHKPPAVQLNEVFLEEISQASQTRRLKQLLTEGADVNYQDADGYTALMIVVDNQNDRIAEYLLAQGADPLLKNKHGETASNLASKSSHIFSVLIGYELHYSLLNGDLEQIQRLVHLGVDVNFRGLGGYTPLLIAIEQENVAAVSCLLEAGADPTLTRDDGQGVFDLVTDEDILALLEEKSQEKEVSESLPDEENPKYTPDFFSGAGGSAAGS